MLQATDDLRIAGLRPLISPAILMEQNPLTEVASETVAAGRRQLRDIIEGRDDRLVVVVGPCSIHNPEAAREYARRLTERARALQDTLLVIMRVWGTWPLAVPFAILLMNLANPLLDRIRPQHRKLEVSNA